MTPNHFFEPLPLLDVFVCFDEIIPAPDVPVARTLPLVTGTNEGKGAPLITANHQHRCHLCYTLYLCPRPDCQFVDHYAVCPNPVCIERFERDRCGEIGER